MIIERTVNKISEQLSCIWLLLSNLFSNQINLLINLLTLGSRQLQIIKTFNRELVALHQLMYYQNQYLIREWSRVAEVFPVLPIH